MSFSRFITKATIVIRGHILNFPWKSRMERRLTRGAVTAEAVGRYLGRYVNDEAATHSLPSVSPNQDSERVFSIWFQGERQAPPIVQACFRSIRKHSKLPLVILDERSIFDWIELPEYIVRKWRNGKIRHAHFADICRVALLYRYGGYWMDATDFLPAPPPQWLDEADFFVYMSESTSTGFYSYIQNCFIRAKKGNLLCGKWLEAIYAYWEQEDSTIDYFMHQLLFRKVVESDRHAAELFATMPRISQEATHELWYGFADKAFDEEQFGKVCRKAVFQKCDYKSDFAKLPPKGSFAEHIINAYR